MQDISYLSIRNYIISVSIKQRIPTPTKHLLKQVGGVPSYHQLPGIQMSPSDSGKECGRVGPSLYSLEFFFFFFFFFFFCFFAFGGLHPWHMEIPRLGVQRCSHRPTLQPQQHLIQAVLATYTTAHDNAGSLTHRARLGIEPATLWFLVGFVPLSQDGNSFL